MKDGPYLSQFLLVGNEGRRGDGSNEPCTSHTAHDVEAGLIVYGDQAIDQRIYPHKAGVDYMTSWPYWLAVQNGAKVGGVDLFEAERRFITTPRDLASFVHFDALYQAYLNACLILLKLEAPFDQGFPDHAKHPTRAAFASFGGPHILTLLTEVATRALRAVRRQKFLIHRRCRPEALAGLLTLHASGHGGQLCTAAEAVGSMVAELSRIGLLSLVEAQNAAQNAEAIACLRRVAAPGMMDTTGLPDITKNFLLPMAFPEGSPAHPSYGAGHATVAGACVTVLKAFFQMYRGNREDPEGWDELSLAEVGFTSLVKPDPDDASTLQKDTSAWVGDLKLQHELNKLAANIAIGRDMAGVHYYTDYYESLRMGERVAVGMLQEQMLCYGEPVSMRFHSFDGDKIAIRTTGDHLDAAVEIDGDSGKFCEWLRRHVADLAIANAGAARKAVAAE